MINFLRLRAARPVAFAVALIAAGALHPPAAHAHSQTRSPGACVSSNIGGNNWGNPGRAVSDNSSYATVSVNDDENSDRLQCTGYGFSIPAGATILGIIVNVERRVNNTAAPTQDFQMRVIKGGAVQAADRSTATAYTLVDTVGPHGSATDLWGAAWTAADINAANFGAAFAVFKNGTAGGNLQVSVDHVQVVVHYSQPPPAPTLVSPADASSTTNTQPTLDWTDVVDPDGDTVTYDVQADNSGCGFPSPEVNQTGLAASTFTPGAPLAAGTYCWRVRAVDEHGVASAWSTANTVTVAPIVNPSSFDAVEVGAAKNTAIRTRISGAGFSLDVLALDGIGNILAGYTGTVTVEIVDAASGVCAAMTSLQNLGSFTFTAPEAGRKTVAFNYANAAVNARIRIIDSGAGVSSCSFDNFAIRPSSITVNVSDADWASAGGTRTLNNTNASASPVHRAGQPFRVTAVPQPGTVTQYAGTPTVSSATCLALAGMSGCADGAVTLPAAGWSGTGTRINDSATYSEAGALTLALEDATFASVDNADSSAAERVIPQTAAIQVGRFVPDRFAVAPANTPQFQTFGAACAGARSFTYAGQPFGYVTTPVALTPVALVTAQNASGGTTTNYRESLWKITTAAPSDVTQTYSNAVGPALDVSQATNAPTVSPANNGTGTVTVSALDRIAHTRPAAPIAPFNADVSLTITVRDDAESEGQITTTAATPFASIAFDSGAEFRYGRLAMMSANGSHLVPLALPMEAQYWNGTLFVTNAADNCTTVAAANVGLGNFSGLVSGDTTPSIAGAFASGRKTVTLSAPGAGKVGFVDVVVNLNAAAGAFNSCTAFGPPPPAPSGAGLAHLRGRWCGAGYDRDATARARFGVYRGAEEVIFIRENY